MGTGVVDSGVVVHGARGPGTGGTCSRCAGGGLHGDAVQRLKTGNVVVLLSVGGQFAGPDGGDVEKLLHHAAQGEFDFLGGGRAAVPGPDLFHFRVQDVHGVAAQGHDRRVHGPGLALLLKGAGRAGHDAAGLCQRLGLFLRCRQPDGFQR